MMRIEQSEHLLILRAQETKDVNELKELSRNQYSNVRRCVAKNRNTPRQILNSLAYDPVSNVSYAALKNLNCTVKRDMSVFTNKCVLCPKNEANYKFECSRCS